MIKWLEQSPTLVTSIIGLFVFTVLLGLGWLLRSQAKIRFGTSYSIFSLIAAFGVWLFLSHEYGLLKDWRLDFFLKWYAAIVVFLAVWFAIKILSTFFWDFYLFERRSNIRIPFPIRDVFIHEETSKEEAIEGVNRRRIEGFLRHVSI
jgi:hypothetical protein